MAGRGSALTRTIRWFKEAELEEMEVAFELVKRTVAARLEQDRRDAPTPVKKARKARRTKAEVASASGAGKPAHQSPSQAVTEGESLASA